MATILVVDDEVGIRELLSEILADEGHSVLTAENAARARDRAGARADRSRAARHLDARHRRRDAAEGVGFARATDDARHHDVGPRDDRHRRRGHALRRARVPRKADRHGAPAVGGPFRPGAWAGDAHPAVAAAGEGSLPRRPRKRQRWLRSSRRPPAPPADTHNGVPLDQPLREARDQFERVYFEFHLAREGYSMTRVAERAGLERTHLYRKLKQLGIELAPWRAARSTAGDDPVRGGGTDARRGRAAARLCPARRLRRLTRHRLVASRGARP